MALFNSGTVTFRNPISINRDEVMRISKISSKATIINALRIYHSLNINYEPSIPFKGHVILFNFSEAQTNLKSERKPK
jgi:hypothetical protein